MTSFAHTLTNMLINWTSTEPHTQSHTALYQSVVENFPDGVIVFDATTRQCLVANHAFSVLTGYEPHELSALDLAQLIATDDDISVDELDSWLTYISLENAIPEQAIHCYHKNGHVIEADVRFFPLSAADNNYYGLLIRNIIDSQKADGSQPNTIPDNFVRLNLNGDYLDIHLIDGISSIIPSADMKGYNLYDFESKSTADAIMQMCRLAVETKEIVQFDYQRESNGQIHYVEARVSATNEEEVFMLVHDETERYQKETMIGYQSKLLDSVSDAIVTIDLNRQITSWNRAAVDLYGYTVEDVLSRSVEEIIPRDFVDSSLDELMAAVAQQGNWQGEQIHYLRDGRMLFVWASISYIFDRLGIPMGMVAVLRDITSQKQAERLLPLVQQSESLKTLAGGIAHDFNNLLTNILTQSTMALNQLPENHKAADYLRKALKFTESVADLTRQLLAFAGQGTYVVEALDYNQMIRDNLGLLETVLPSNARLNLSLDPMLPLVEMDRSHAQQLIMNLLINAGQALTEEGGEICITTSAPELHEDALVEYTSNQSLPSRQYVQFEVVDNGIGMDGKTISRIFNPYFTTKESGSGLGLAATLGIVQRYHGGIHVESQLGKGTKFQLIFPAATKVQPIAQNPSYPAAAGPNQKSGHDVTGTILVIDDEASIREVLKEILENEGHQVILATNGQNGLSCYQSQAQRVDLVLLDMNMPDMSGKQTLAALREFTPDLPIIFCSGYNQTDIIDTHDDPTITTFLPKPFQLATLISMVHDVLARAKAVDASHFFDC